MLWRFKRALGLRPAKLQASPRQVVFITGCDSGLGLCLARTARARGLTVVAGLLDGPQGSGGRLLQEPPDHALHLLQLDVTSDASVLEARDYVEKLLQDNPEYTLHAVVNNAGVMALGEFEWQPGAMAERHLAVNVGGAWRVARALLPALRRAARRGGRPRLMAAGSHCALQPLKALSTYSASKAALRAWAEALRVELRPHGVHVIDYIPGRMISSTNLVAQQKKYSEEMRSSMSSEQKEFYGEYFERFVAYVDMVGAQARGPGQMEDEVLQEMFAAALLDAQPAPEYKQEPWIYTLYYTLFKIVPAPLRIWLMEKHFLRLPLYSPQHINKN